MINILNTNKFCFIGFLFSLLLLSGCVKDEISEKLSESSEIKFSTSVNTVKSGTKCEEASSNSSPVSIIELKSDDGSIVVPMAMFVSSESAELKGSVNKGNELINNTGSDQLFPTTLPFTVHAFNGTNDFFADNDSTAVWNSGRNRWTLDNKYFWPAEAELEFYAYANMPENPVEKSKPKIAFVERDLTRHVQRLTYEVPDHTDKHRDILLAVYKGLGNGCGEAELTFQHPLAAIQFARDESATDLTGTISITMEGVYYRGYVEQSIDNPEILKWTPEKKGTTVTQDNHGLPLEVHGGIDGDPFLVIPQVTKPGEQLPKISFRLIMRVNGHDIPLNGEASKPVWKPGETVTYVIGYSGGLRIALECNDVSETERRTPVVKNTDVRYCYVRAMVLGYIFNDKNQISETWLNDDLTLKGTMTPTGFGSKDTPWNTSWIKGADGFYYYKKPLHPEKPDHSNASDAKTTPLFDKYVIDGLSENQRFLMDIAVQSVEYDKDKDYVKTAWGSVAAGYLETLTTE